MHRAQVFIIIACALLLSAQAIPPRIESGTGAAPESRPDIAFDVPTERVADSPTALALYRPTVGENLLQTGERFDIFTITDRAVGIHRNVPAEGFVNVGSVFTTNILESLGQSEVGDFVRVGDVNGDGYTDVIIVHEEADVGFTLVLGDGTGAVDDFFDARMPLTVEMPIGGTYTFGDAGALDSGSLVTSVAIADMDDDGKDDIIIGVAGDASCVPSFFNDGENCNIVILFSDVTGGSVSFTRETLALPSGQHNVTHVAALDLDRSLATNGYVEIIAVSNESGAGVEWGIDIIEVDVGANDGIRSSAFLGSPLNVVFDLEVADLDRNGRADIILAGQTINGAAVRSEVGVWFNDDFDIATARLATSGPIGVGPDEAKVVAVADLDAQYTTGSSTHGFLEIVVAGEGNFHGREPTDPHPQNVGIMTALRLEPIDGQPGDEALALVGQFPFGDADCGTSAVDVDVTDIAIGLIDTDGLPDVVITDRGQGRVHIIRSQPLACATFVTFATHGQVSDLSGEDYLDEVLLELRERVQGARDRCNPDFPPTINEARRPGMWTSMANPVPDLCPVQVITVSGHWEQQAISSLPATVTGRGAAVASMTIPTPIVGLFLPVSPVPPGPDYHPIPYWLKFPYVFIDAASQLRYLIVMPASLVGDALSARISGDRFGVASDILRNTMNEAIARARGSMEPTCGQLVVDLTGYSRGGAQVGELLRTLDGDPLVDHARMGATLLDATDREQPDHTFPWRRTGYVLGDPLISEGAATRDERWVNISCAWAADLGPLNFVRDVLSFATVNYDWGEAVGFPRGHDRRASLNLDGVANPTVGFGDTCDQPSDWWGNVADPGCVHQPMPCFHAQLHVEQFYNRDNIDRIIPEDDPNDPNDEFDGLVASLAGRPLLQAIVQTMTPAEIEYFSIAGSTLVGELLRDPRGHADFVQPHFTGWRSGNAAEEEPCFPEELEEAPAVRPLSAPSGRTVDLTEGRDGVTDDGGAERVIDPSFLGLRALVARAERLRTIVDGLCNAYGGTYYAGASQKDQAIVNGLDGIDTAWQTMFCEALYDPDAQRMPGLLEDAANGWPDAAWRRVAGDPAVGSTSGDLDEELLAMFARVLPPLPFDPDTVTDTELEDYLNDVQDQIDAWELNPGTVDEEEIALLAQEVSQLASGFTSALEAFVTLPDGVSSGIEQRIDIRSLRDDTLRVRIIYAFTHADGSLALDVSGPGLSDGGAASGTAQTIGQRQTLEVVASRGVAWESFEQDVVLVSGGGVQIFSVLAGRDAPAFFGTTGKYYEHVSHSGGLTWEHAEAFAAQRTHAGRVGRLARVATTGEKSFLFQEFGLEEPAWVGATWQITDPAPLWEGGAPVTLSYAAGGTEPRDEVHHLYLQATGGGDKLLHDRTRPVRGETAFGYIIEYAP